MNPNGKVRAPAALLQEQLRQSIRQVDGKQSDLWLPSRGSTLVEEI